MAHPFFELDLKEKIDALCISPYDWSKNLICLAHRSRIVVGIIKFQEELEDLEQEVGLSIIEEHFHGPRVHHLAWSPASSLNKLPSILQFCAAGSDFSLRVFNSDLVSKRTTRKEIQGHEDYINSCCFDSEGEYLASVSDDLTCKLWAVSEQYECAAAFQLTSPGMSVCWNSEEPHSVLVLEKNGTFRMYSSLTLSSVMSVACSPAPMVHGDWSTPNHVAYLAAGILHRADITVPGHMVEQKTVHPEGGYAVSSCPANPNYIATVGRPNNMLKITNIKTKATIITTNLKLFGGMSWHSRLPVLCVANNSSIAMFRVTAK